MASNEESYLAGTVSEGVREAANTFFDDVKEVDLSLTLNDNAFSYEDTWHLTVECNYAELENIREFISVIGPDTVPVMVDMCAVAGKLVVNFHCWKSDVGDLWGRCPELERGPYPGMEFERPEHYDCGLL